MRKTLSLTYNKIILKFLKKKIYIVRCCKEQENGSSMMWFDVPVRRTAIEGEKGGEKHQPKIIKSSGRRKKKKKKKGCVVEEHRDRPQ